MRRAPIMITVLVGMTGVTSMGQSNVVPDHKFSWTENVGWTSWRSEDGTKYGVYVGTSYLSGMIWGENIGWINIGNRPDDWIEYGNIDETDFGVNIDTKTGDLFGYAWVENVGWINFDTASLGSDRARFDLAELRFRGYAWGENIGWINLDDSEHYVASLDLTGIPTVSQWGLVTMVLMMLTAGTIFVRHYQIDQS